MSGRVTKLASLAAVAAALTSGTALAATGGRSTVTITQHAHDVVLLSMPSTNPCTGEPGIITAVAENEVLHITYFTTGDEFWVTGTDEGTVTFTPDDPNGVAASGHFASWFGESSNNQNDVQHDAQTFVLKGTDGSLLVAHSNDHLSTNANGVVTVSLGNVNLHCG